MVPIYAIAFVIPHACKERAAGFSLLDNVFNDLRTPVIIFSVIEGVFSDGHGISRAEDHTSMAADAVFLAASYLIIGSIIAVHIETALVDTNLTLYAAV
jgi:hypothetical protein